MIGYPHPDATMRFALCLPALLICACSTTPAVTRTPQPDQTVRIPGSAGGMPQSVTIARREEPTVRTFRASPDKVWEAIPRVYQTLGIPVSDRDVAARTIGNSSHKVRRRLGDVALSRYLDCGSAQGAPSADTYEVLMTMMSRVQPAADSGGTMVVTTVSALARPIAFTSDYITCGSKGGLEKRFFEILELETRS